jgi:hypothetical protein
MKEAKEKVTVTKPVSVTSVGNALNTNHLTQPRNRPRHPNRYPFYKRGVEYEL